MIYCTITDLLLVTYGPILHGIVQAYESFTKYDENFWNSAIFENGALS